MIRSGNIDTRLITTEGITSDEVAARMATPATWCLAINWTYFLRRHYVVSPSLSVCLHWHSHCHCHGLQIFCNSVSWPGYLEITIQKLLLINTWPFTRYLGGKLTFPLSLYNQDFLYITFFTGMAWDYIFTTMAIMAIELQNWRFTDSLIQFDI